MNLDEIINYRQVSDRIASSGQPEKQQFEWIASAGYEAVVNLSMPDSENALADEGSVVSCLKMIYVHIPVPFDAPQRRHLSLFLQFMSALSGQRVWVHCALNYRVSAFLYQYWRLSLGASPEQAQQVMLPTWKPDSVWRQFMSIEVDEAERPVQVP